MLTDAAVFEVTELSKEAEHLAQGGASDRARSAVLVQRIATIKSTGLSSNEARQKYSNELNARLNPHKADFESRYSKAFANYVASGGDEALRVEMRDLAVGAMSITSTAGAAGGYLIPIEYRNVVFEAMAQVDPIVDPDVCDCVFSDSPTLRPEIINGYDLSTIAASQVNEGVQQIAGTVPTIAGRILRANLIYKISLAASLEAETDIPNLLGKLSRAYGVAMGRKLGADAINGSGTTTPQGLMTALTSSYSTLNSGKIVYQDITSIFFGVNAFYRNQPKCGWLMGDTAYERVRNAVDNSGRPLLDFSKDKLELMSKPVYISPTVGLNIVFGDLNHFHIRCSAPTLQRSQEQSVSDITKGESLFIGRIRMDSCYFDPSGGSAPAITLSTVTP